MVPQCNNANKMHLNIKIHVTLKTLNKHNCIYLTSNVSFIKKRKAINRNIDGNLFNSKLHYVIYN